MRAAGVLMLLALVAGCAAPAVPAPASSPSTPAVASTPTPTRVTITALNIDAPLSATGLDQDGQVVVPPVDQPMQAAYLRWGAQLAAHPLVILAHVNGRDAHRKAVPGLFAHLTTLAPEDSVTVAYSDGSTRSFTVLRAIDVPKDRFPTDEVYGSTEPGQLRLITCTGDFNPKTHSYLDNHVVFAQGAA